MSQSGGQCGIVAQHRADTDQDRVNAGAQLVRLGPRRLIGDPLGLAAGGGNLSIQRHPGFEDSKGAAGLHTMDVRFIELRGRGLAATDLDLHAGSFQLRNAFALHLRVGIDHRHDDAADS